nr:uncharacterized protein LOC118879688 [Drosophila suzukii]
MQGGKYLRSQRQLEEDLSTDQPALTEEEEACEKHFTPQVTVLGSGCVQITDHVNISQPHYFFLNNEVTCSSYSTRQLEHRETCPSSNFSPSPSLRLTRLAQPSGFSLQNLPSTTLAARTWMGRHSNI